MRNKFPGPCYRCGARVDTGAGHFEKFGAGWRVPHATCAIEMRGTPDPLRRQANDRRDQFVAQGTGRPAQRARKRIRDRVISDFGVLD